MEIMLTLVNNYFIKLDADICDFDIHIICTTYVYVSIDCAQKRNAQSVLLEGIHLQKME